MNLRQLEVFISIARYGNFSKAAKKLYLTQPTISSHIDSLEKELGIILFERRSREAVLTGAGKVFYSYAVDILTLKQRAIESIEKYKGGIRGKVSICTSSTPGVYFLPSILESLNCLYPEVRFDVSISNTAEVVSALLSYQAELGFVGSLHVHDHLEYLCVFEDEMVLISPKTKDYEHLPDYVSFADIRNLRFVLRGQGSATRCAFEESLATRGTSVDELNISIELDSMAGVKNCVKRGIGVSVVPSMCVSREDNLRVLRINDLDLSRKFYAVHNRKRVLSPVVERIIKHLREERSTGNEKGIS